MVAALFASICVASEPAMDAIAVHWTKAIQNRELVAAFVGEVSITKRIDLVSTEELVRIWLQDERLRIDRIGVDGVRTISGINCPRRGTTFRFLERPQSLIDIHRITTSKKSIDVFDPRLVGMTYMPTNHRYGHGISSYFTHLQKHQREIKIVSQPGSNQIEFRCGLIRSPAINTIVFDRETSMPLRFIIESGGERDTINMNYMTFDGVHFPTRYEFRSERNGKEIDYLRLDFRNVKINQPFDESAFELRGFDLRDDTHIRFEGDKRPEDYVWSNRSLVPYEKYRKQIDDGGSTVIDEPILVDSPNRWPWGWLAGVVAMAIVAIAAWRRYRSRS